MKFLKWIAWIIIVSVCTVSALYFLLLTLRPDRTNITSHLFTGVTYQRVIKDTPRAMILHVIQIDLNTPGVSLMVTPFDQDSARNHYLARTTSDFIEEFDVQLAINASFFYPFEENTPWDFYPKNKEPVTAVGLVTSNQKSQSTSGASFSQLCIGQTVSIAISGCPADSRFVVSGSSAFISNGQLKISGKSFDTSPYPRTAAALDANREKLWLVVVDGKQKDYSEGITLAELGHFLIELGADMALNLDGGGSSSVGTQVDKKIKILNSPIHTRIPLRQRPVANHLGIFADPLTANSGEPVSVK